MAPKSLNIFPCYKIGKSVGEDLDLKGAEKEFITESFLKQIL